ncbi:MAG TPA: tyrosine-type recombinase/integrase [Arenicellales bacterium]|nr:tyrosine-type recombinase/integrase [Arenicellales bacterium]
MRIKIRYVVEDMDRHGNVRIYVRPPGQGKVRIRHPLGSPEFWRAYEAAIHGKPPTEAARPTITRAAPKSLRALCEAYYRSPEFTRLAESTRSVRRKLLESVCLSTGPRGTPRGDLPYALMEPKHVRRIRDEHAAHPDGANGRMKALRQLFAWAVDSDRASHNPAKEVPYLKSTGDGFHTWTLEEVWRFEEYYPIGTKARLAMALLLYTGVRRCDVVTLGRQMARDGWLHFTEGKGRDRQPKHRAIPILPELQAVIDATPSGHMTYLVTEFGKPFTAAGFGNKFRDWCNAAGLPHCSAHGLRKAGATIAADNGATEHQLMAIYGWNSPKQAALYTRRANRRKLAGDAMHLIRLDRNANESVPPADPGKIRWDKTAGKSN